MRLRAGHILAIGAGALIAALAAVVVVDVLDVGNTGSAYQQVGGAALWPDLYANNAPVEWVQWGMLAAAGLLGATLAGRLRAAGERRYARLWGLIAVAAVLMLIEDAGDPRHGFSQWVLRLAGVADIHHSPWRVATEGAVFGVVALPALVALRDVPALRTHRGSLALLGGGYLAYAVAAGASWTSNLGDWYNVAGAWLMTTAVGDWLPAFGERTGFWVLDRILEESLELAGATLLCAAVVAFRARWAQAGDAPGHASSSNQEAISLAG